jgi:hypothetical protein
MLLPIPYWHELFQIRDISAALFSMNLNLTAGKRIFLGNCHEACRHRKIRSLTLWPTLAMACFGCSLARSQWRRPSFKLSTGVNQTNLTFWLTSCSFGGNRLLETWKLEPTAYIMKPRSSCPYLATDFPYRHLHRVWDMQCNFFYRFGLLAAVHAFRVTRRRRRQRWHGTTGENSREQGVCMYVCKRKKSPCIDRNQPVIAGRHRIRSWKFADVSHQ